MALLVPLTLAALASHSLSFAEEGTTTATEKNETTVGMVGRIKEVKIAGSELEVVPLQDRDTPIVVRIVRTFPHGTDFRYEIEYYGLEPGEYDLKDYLRRVDGSSVESIQSLPVWVVPVLPPDAIKPNALVPRKPPSLGGYQRWLIVAGVVWFAGLLMIIFLGRRSKHDANGDSERPKTLAERLRPLVDRAVSGEASQTELASLERSLLTYWRKRLSLEATPAAEAMRKLRGHPEASGLMTQLEAWLHQPGASGELDIETLLAPYRNVPEQDFEMERSSESGEPGSSGEQPPVASRP